MTTKPDSWYQPLLDRLAAVYEEPVEYRQGFGNTVELYNSDLDLYVRILPGVRLTIARIDVGVNRTRKGIGTMILECCKSICKEYRIPVIIMESVLTEECASFCRKHGFIPRQFADYDFVLELS